MDEEFRININEEPYSDVCSKLLHSFVVILISIIIFILFVLKEDNIDMKHIKFNDYITYIDKDKKTKKKYDYGRLWLI